MKKAGGVADEEESVDENVMIEAGEIVSDADSAAQPEVQETAEDKPAKKKEKAHKGDAGAVLYSYIAALGLATGTTFKKMLAKPKKLGRNIVGFSDMSSVFSGSDSRSLSTSFLIHSLSRSRTSGAMCARL